MKRYKFSSVVEGGGFQSDHMQAETEDVAVYAAYERLTKDHEVITVSVFCYDRENGGYGHIKTFLRDTNGMPQFYDGVAMPPINSR